MEDADNQDVFEDASDSSFIINHNDMIDPNVDISGDAGDFSDAGVLPDAGVLQHQGLPIVAKVDPPIRSSSLLDVAIQNWNNADNDRHLMNIRIRTAQQCIAEREALNDIATNAVIRAETLKGSIQDLNMYRENLITVNIMPIRRK